MASFRLIQLLEDYTKSYFLRHFNNQIGLYAKPYWIRSIRCLLYRSSFAIKTTHKIFFVGLKDNHCRFCHLRYRPTCISTCSGLTRSSLAEKQPFYRNNFVFAVSSSVAEYTYIIMTYNLYPIGQL